MNAHLTSPVRRIYLWVAGDFVLILGLAFIFARGLVPHQLAVPLALLPGIVSVVLIQASMASYRCMDELQRKIYAEGMVFSFVASLAIFYEYFLLEDFAGFPHVSMWFAGTVLLALQFVGWGVANARYR